MLLLYFYCFCTWKLEVGISKSWVVHQFQNVGKAKMSYDKFHMKMLSHLGDGQVKLNMHYEINKERYMTPCHLFHMYDHLLLKLYLLKFL